MATGHRDTRAMLLEAAREIAPRLKSRARQAADSRRTPDETIAEMQAAGLFRIVQPRRCGGFELDWDTLCEVSRILATADGSQAWVLGVMADHAQLIANFPEDALGDVWGASQNTLASASVEPAGRASRVAGGFKVSGRHRFASGIDHASWLICGGFIEDKDRLDGPYYFLIPKTDVTVIDDWDTMGLEGTGSKTFEVRSVFVPSHRVVNGELTRTGFGPGAKADRSTVYKLPRGGVVPTIFSALAVGMARGVLDEWLHFAGPRRANGAPLSEQHANLLVAAEATVELEAAQDYYRAIIARGTGLIEAGGQFDEMGIIGARSRASYACRMAVAAGHRIFGVAGAHALFNEHHLGRQYRNLLAAGNHFAVNWNVHAPLYGKMVLERSTAP